MEEELKASAISTPYPYMEWARNIASSPELLGILLRLEELFALCVIAGLCTRLATIGTCFNFFVIFHQCGRYHNNHYIFIIWISGAACFINWGRKYSIDAAIDRIYSKLAKLTADSAADNGCIPFWSLWMMQFLYCVPYFFGGIAKLQYDWLVRLMPPTSWFAPGNYMNHPLEAFTSSRFAPHFICWGGVLFDLLEPVLLLSLATIFTVTTNREAMVILGIASTRSHDAPKYSRTGKFMLLVRKYYIFLMPLAFLGSLIFNCMNKALLGIGVFPYAMMWSLVIFMPPGTIDTYTRMLMCNMGTQPRLRRAVPLSIRTSSPNVVGNVDEKRLQPAQKQLEADFFCDNGDGTESRIGDRLARMPTFRKLFGPVFLVLFVCFHVMYPLRSKFVSPQFVSWHEEGHIHAWNMKLRSKRASVEFLFDVRDTRMHGENATTQVLAYIPSFDPALGGFGRTKTQKLMKNIKTRPYETVHYLKFMRLLHELAGYTIERISARSCASLNGRPKQHFFIEEADLNAYIDSYWIPFTTCVGNFVEPLRPIPWFADETALKKRSECKIDDIPLGWDAKRHEAGFAYFDLHRRAGLRLTSAFNPPESYVAGAPSNVIMWRESAVIQSCKVPTAPKGVISEDTFSETAVMWHWCFSFFRFPDAYRRARDVIAIGHPWYNLTHVAARVGGDIGSTTDDTTVVEGIALHMYNIDSVNEGDAVPR